MTPFMNNLYKQLECISKDKRKYYNANKRQWDMNCIPTEILEQIPDNKNIYQDMELLLDLQNLPCDSNLNCSEIDKQVLIGLATGQICKKNIPAVLVWTNKDDRKKLSRYMKKLQKLCSQLLSFMFVAG